MIDRRNLQAFHPFVRLNRLLDGIAPGRSILPGGAPLALSVGEPRNNPPGFVAEAIAANAADWSRYPTPRGTPAYLQAAADWLQWRYALPESATAPGGMIDPDTSILPVPGTREGLFFAALAAVPPSRDGRPPVILIPSPAYHVYAGAAAAAGAEAVFVPSGRETGDLPDFESLDPDILARTALCYLCSPSNPQGIAADKPYYTGLIKLARRHDFVVAFDECYAEIYTDAPPAGALEAALDLGGTLDRMLVFHSLSKRSNAPGLRCGFVAGPPNLLEPLDSLQRVGGAGVPLPVIAAGTRLWQDNDHVGPIRAFYQDNFAIAERVLGNRFGFRKPDGGFFLWLDVGDGEAAARTLWAEAGLRVLPGGYMCGDAAAAQNGGSAAANPGAAHIRVALIYGPEITEAALRRIADLL